MPSWKSVRTYWLGETCLAVNHPVKLARNIIGLKQGRRQSVKQIYAAPKDVPVQEKAKLRLSLETNGHG